MCSRAPSQTEPRRLPRRSVLAGLAMTGAATGEGAAQSSGVKFGTSGEGGGFIIYAGAFVDAIKWANPSIGVKPVPTRGSVENVPLLQEGKLDIGLVFGEVAQQLFNPKEGSPTKLKVICTVYASPRHVRRARR
jgi:TRAP-type uncharacterized transport system substrate-binding protein